jgi:hypothetical protein
MYDYYEVVKEDIREYIEDNIDFEEYESLEELEEYLNDVLWVTDSVTGNASGSYTISTYKAMQNLIDNLDLLGEAFECFCCDVSDVSKTLGQGAEVCDVTIRCYLLNECVQSVLEEMGEEFDNAHNMKEV